MEILLAKSEGIFLLVSSVIQNLRHFNMGTELDRILSKHPLGLEDLYRRMLLSSQAGYRVMVWARYGV